MGQNITVFERKKSEFFNWLYLLLVKILGNKITSVLIIIVILGGILMAAYLYFDTVRTNASSRRASEIALYSPTPIPSPEPTEVTKLKDGEILGEADDPCKGRKFDIMEELDDAKGTERPFHPDPNNLSVVSASSSPNFQVSKKYPFPCPVPWVSEFTFTPLLGKSIGAFFEYEGVFKILIGDGDMINWTIQQNDSATRGKWPVVSKEKLNSGRISTDKEVTVQIKVNKIVGNLIYGEFRISYWVDKRNHYEWESHNFTLQPTAVDLVSNPARSFRIGMNDYRYKGLGSLIDFGSFSVKSDN